MAYSNRKKLYKQLETLRSNPLIVYITSSRPGAEGNMAGDSLCQIIDQIEKLPPETKEVDLLIESSGGDGLVAWRIVSLLRSKIKKVNVLIPNGAFSAATLLALGGDEIVMGKYGCLGPIDPQITVKRPDGSEDRFAYEDILGYLDFIQNEVGLSEQKHRLEAFKLLCSSVNPSSLGFAKRASSLSVEMGEKLLLTHMDGNPESRAKAKDIANRLNKSFFSHGHALYASEAEKIGLNIKKASEDEERLMWGIHLDFEEEINTRRPFDPLAEFLSDPGASSYLSLSLPNLTVPTNIQQSAVNQLIVSHIQAQLNQTGPVVIRTVKNAFVESCRISSEFSPKIQILVARDQDLRFKVTLAILETGWKNIFISRIVKTRKKKVSKTTK